MTHKTQLPVLYKPNFSSSNTSLVFTCIRVDSSESIESSHLLSLLTYDSLLEPTSHRTKPCIFTGTSKLMLSITAFSHKNLTASACVGSIPPLFRAFQMASISEFPPSGAPLPHRITLQLEASIVYIVLLSITSWLPADTSAHSHAVRWRPCWALSRRLPCPWSQKP
jgi:hypothetical protein